MPGPEQIPKIQGVPSNSTLRFGYIQPGAVAGQVGPGIYYLSPLANVPFVTFVGAEGYEKTISWGECMENRSQGLLRIKNGSFHAGEVVIGSGQCAPFACPARITVPTVLTQVNGADVPPFPAPPYASVTTTMRLDTRRAKTAWLYVSVTHTDPTPAIIQVIGQAIERFHVDNNPASTFPGYTNTMTVMAGTEVRRIPLGFGASLGEVGVPHALLDVITRVNFGASGAFITPLAISTYYVLEYL